jgi:hypothetical protein
MFCHGARCFYASAPTASASTTASSPAVTSAYATSFIGCWEVPLPHDLLDPRFNLRAKRLDELRSDSACGQMNELAFGHETRAISCQLTVAYSALPHVVHVLWQRWETGDGLPLDLQDFVEMHPIETRDEGAHPLHY